jgi:hypothetical protein
MSRAAFALLFLAAFCAKAEWGLGPENIVESCQSKAIEKCETFRGRSNKTNGTASTIIWKVGTKRIVFWGAATKAANDAIKDKMDFNHTLYADFRVCPMEKTLHGHRTAYCVDEIKNPRWTKIE